MVMSEDCAGCMPDSKANARVLDISFLVRVHESGISKSISDVELKRGHI